jgi:hypothetical protein
MYLDNESKIIINNCLDSEYYSIEDKILEFRNYLPHDDNDRKYAENQIDLLHDYKDKIKKIMEYIKEN